MISPVGPLVSPLVQSPSVAPVPECPRGQRQDAAEKKSRSMVVPYSPSELKGA